MDGIDGMTAVITGATSGIGRSIAHALATKGVNLCLIGRNQKELECLEDELKNKEINIRIYICELGLIEDIERTADEIIKNNTRVDILVHSAGSIIIRDFETITVDEFDLQYFVNTRAPFLITQLLLPRIRSQKGQIIFINSSASKQKARASFSAYTASKYALVAIADSLREEVNAHGVRVLSIYPGRTATAMQEEIHKTEKKKYQPDLLLQPDDVAQCVVSALLMPRTAEITDISVRPFKKS